MTSSDPIKNLSASGEPTPQTPPAQTYTPTLTTEGAANTVSREQADQILQELKSIKQNIFWLLLVTGFFAARSVFFHY